MLGQALRATLLALAQAKQFRPARRGASRGFGAAFELPDSAVAVSGVAIMIAVGEVRSDFPQIAFADRLAAQHAMGSRGGYPAIHQYEFHVAPPNAKQNTVSAES